MSCTVEQLPAASSAGGTANGGAPASWNRIKLSKELASAVQDDARRKAIDAAKKRAVSQHVDYETFQAMVSVAHLKPIERDEWFRKPAELHSSPAWNFSAEGSLSDNMLTLNRPLYDCASKKQLSGFHNGPKNAEEFQKRWRSLSGSAEDRLRFLRSIPSEKLLPLFKVEIRPALLGEIFSVLDECWERNELQSPAENPSSKESTTEALEGAMGSMTIEEPSATLRREGEANGDGSINDFETNTENLGAVPQRSEAPSGLPQLDGSYTNKECKGPLRTDAGADADPLARIASTGASETEVTQERTPSGSRVDAAENKPHVSSVASCEKQKNDLQGNEETADPQTGNSVEEILDVLTALSKSGRFGLTVRLLSGGHKKDMRSFFEKLRVATVRQGAADTLERLKGVEALFQV